MTKLDDLQRQLEALKTGKKPASERILDAISDLDTKGLRKEIKELRDQMSALPGLSRLMREVGTYDLEKTTRTINARFERVERGLEKMTQLLKPIETDLGPVVSLINDLKGEMSEFRGAVDGYRNEVHGIEIPRPEPFPEIPAPPDIKPLIDAVQALDMKIDMVTKAEPVVIDPSPPAGEWTFDVIRNQSGFIKKVVATQGG